jgi:hypothetical protein
MMHGIRTISICLTVIASLLVATICTVIVSSHAVPNGLYVGLSSCITGIVGLHVGNVMSKSG